MSSGCTCTGWPKPTTPRASTPRTGPRTSSLSFSTCRPSPSGTFYPTWSSSRRRFRSCIQWSWTRRSVPNPSDGEHSAKKSDRTRGDLSPFCAATPLRRTTRHPPGIGWLTTRWQRLSRLAGPRVALFIRCVEGQPDFGLGFDVEEVPVQVVPWQVELLLGRGQNVAEDQAIKLPIGEMIGKVQNDSL